MNATALKERPQAVADLNVTVDRGDLLRALGHASAIVERKNIIPVLANVLIEAADDELRITSTDLNMQIALALPARVSGEGVTTVSASLLHSIVREIPTGSQIELQSEDGRLHFCGGRSRYKLQTLPADHFPQLKDETPLCAFELKPDDLLRAFGAVSAAQDTDVVARPYCCGINLEAHGGSLTLVAVDGKRIAWSVLETAHDIELPSAILSSKFIATLTKLLDGHEGSVRAAFDDRKVTIELGDAVLTGKMVDGAFPPWRRIVPEGGGKRMLIDVTDFETAVRRVSLVGNERSRAVKLELGPDRLTISCFSSENGLAVEEIPCVWDSGNMVRGFNAKFLLDALAALKAGELQVDFHEGDIGLAYFTKVQASSANWLLAPMAV